MANKSGPPFNLAHGPEPAEGLLSVVIPVYNEKDFLAQVVRLVQATPYRKEIVIVDDASTDGTREVVDQLRSDEVRVFHHERNQGKGAALRTGFAQTKGDIVLIQDADLEYSPADYPRSCSRSWTGGPTRCSGRASSAGRIA